MCAPDCADCWLQQKPPQLVNNVCSHVDLFQKWLYRIVKNQFLCEENEWDFYFQNPTCALSWDLNMH